MADAPPSLFGRLPSIVRPAAPPARLHELGALLPTGLRLGTSSWSYPGWAGLIYEKAHDERELSRTGLEAYAAHPLLHTVGVDRGWYAPVAPGELAAYAEQVPADFTFLAKAHNACTLPSSPYLWDAAYAADMVLAPFVEGFGARAGPLVFQFPASPPEPYGGPDRFAERLHRFLADLPRGPIVAVEVRHRALLTHRYAEALRAAGAAHCLNVVPGMPTIATQARIDRAVGSQALVARWMQHPAWAYEQARDAFTPFDRLHAPLDAARDELAEVVVEAVAAGRPCWVVAGNKAEGCAPRTIARLAEAIVARTPA